MQEWLATQAANGFKEFAGTEITASIHMSEALLNELLADAVQEWASASPSSASGGTLAGALAKFVTAASVKIGEGVVVAKLQVRVQRP